MEFDINTKENGIIIAPAGCGKTETIIKIIESHNYPKKVLILTHTNAGIENIERRLSKKHISSSKYNIYTIASFCLKYVCNFKDSKITDDMYEKYYLEMNDLMDNKYIKKIIKNTYSLILVDEYQDCTLIQHNMIKKISNIIDYKVFGDPLQSIYNFDNSHFDFHEIINKDYSYLGDMNYPWRWDQTNKNLGKWIMESRKKILSQDYNIFQHLPNCVEYFEYKNYGELQKKAMSFLKLQGRKVVLFNIENRADSFCKKMGGRFYFQEETQCKALLQIGKYIDNKDNVNTIKEIIKLGEKCFTNFKTEYKNIIQKIEKNDFCLSKISKNKNEAIIIMNLNIKFSLVGILKLIKEINLNKKLKIYRKELWIVLELLIENLIIKNESSAKEILREIRNSKMLNNKFKYNNMVSRILLVKGLEFENVFIVDPKNLTPELLYVAISRPTKKLIVAQEISDK